MSEAPRVDHKHPVDQRRETSSGSGDDEWFRVLDAVVLLVALATTL